MFTCSAVTPPKVNQVGWNLEHWVHCRGLAMANFGHNPRSSDCWTAKRIFCQVSNTRFHRFSRWPNFMKFEHNTLMLRRKLSEQNFANLTVRCRFSKNCKNFLIFFNILWLQATITRQWLQIDWNSLPNDPSMGCLVSIFTIGINSKSFPWPVVLTCTTPNFTPPPHWSNVSLWGKNIKVNPDNLNNYICPVGLLPVIYFRQHGPTETQKKTINT